MSHYYTDNRQLPHDRKEISFRFSGLNFTFQTDSGVFSRDRVDTGTAILLNALAKEGLKGRILDMGCGYGVIGIVAGKAFAGTEVVMADVNPRAVECAVSNAQRNGADCKILVSDGFKQIEGSYNIIISNPPIRAGKAVIYTMFEDSVRFLEPEGRLYLVMRKQHGALSAVRKLEELFDTVEIITKDKGFFVIRACRAN